jgi:hypothetical protein
LVIKTNRKNREIMENENQYTLKITNGEPESEQGYFYKAGSFFVKTKNQSFQCNFEKGKAHSVIFEIKQNDTTIAELTHPDYTPELSPGNYVPINKIDENQLSLFAALVKLEITKFADYKTYFEENKSKFSFEVAQKMVIT